MPNNLIKMLANAETLRKWTPAGIRNFARKWIRDNRYDRLLWEQSNPFIGTDKEFSYQGSSGHKVGILFDFGHNHAHYMKACIRLGVSYEVVDITKDDWQDRVIRSGLDTFFAWPSVQNSLWKGLFDERLKMLVQDMGKTICPAWNELWLYESKRRTRDWLMLHGIPHPETHVFFDRNDALDFVADSPLPIVFKSDRGGTSSGVVICRDHRHAVTLIKQYFGKGFQPRRSDPRDRQWGYIIIQEYLENVSEWRMVRIGDWFLCRQKGKIGEFHSGSGQVKWAKPSEQLLNKTKEITDIGSFRSMNVDIFETQDGKLLVNELHALFGAIEEWNLNRNAESMGRWTYHRDSDTWKFEPGFFYQNACADLRIQYMLDI